MICNNNCMTREHGTWISVFNLFGRGDCLLDEQSLKTYRAPLNVHRNLDQDITFHNPNGQSSIQIAKDPDDTFTKESRKLINSRTVIFASEKCKATGNVIYTQPTASSSTSYKEVKKLRPLTLADEQAIQALSTLLEECRKPQKEVTLTHRHPGQWTAS